jgi:fumarate reductase subunit C
LVIPTALFILSLVFGLIAAQIGSGDTQNGELFGEVSPVKQILNILSFSFAGIGLLTWLPCLIVGIILLAKKK